METLFLDWKGLGSQATLPQILTQTALYGYVLFVAANLIGDGAELLLLVPTMAPLVGSIVLPILGAVPDGMMVLCSGLGPDAQEQLAVGVGALAGSTIMLLTLPWFLSVVAGRVSIHDGEPQYTRPQDAPKDWDKLSPPGHLHPFHTGVGVAKELQANAKTMMLTATTYLIIQGAAFYVDGEVPGLSARSSEEQGVFENKFAMAGLAVSIFWFVYYLVNQYLEGQKDDGEVQEHITAKIVQCISSGDISLRGAMAEFHEDARKSSGDIHKALLGADMTDTVKKFVRVLQHFFHAYDRNGDGTISITEFELILHDLHEQVNPRTLEKMFKATDTDNSGAITFDEFCACIMALSLDPSETWKGDVHDRTKRIPKSAVTFTGTFESDKRSNHGEEDDEEEDMPEDLVDLPPEEQQRRIKKRALSKMTLGTLLVLAFSDPMCDMLAIIGDRISVPAFYVSFLVAPLASNASELVTSIKLAQKRTKKGMVNSLGALEGAAVMNNTFCLAIFLALIAFRNLVWKFSAETLSILVVEVIVGALTIAKRVHTVFDGMLILLLYPASMGLVWVMEHVFQWD